MCVYLECVDCSAHIDLQEGIVAVLKKRKRLPNSVFYYDVPCCHGNSVGHYFIMKNNNQRFTVEWHQTRVQCESRNHIPMRCS